MPRTIGYVSTFISAVSQWTQHINNGRTSAVLAVYPSTSYNASYTAAHTHRTERGDSWEAVASACRVARHASLQLDRSGEALGPALLLGLLAHEPVEELVVHVGAADDGVQPVPPRRHAHDDERVGRGDGGAVREPVVVRRGAARVEASDGVDAVEAGDERLELGA